MSKLNDWLWYGIKYLAILLVIVFVLPAIYFWFNYTSDSITKGQAYGFTIGQTKQEVFKSAAIQYKGKQVYFSYPLNQYGYGPFDDMNFTESDYKKIENRNMWDFYFNNKDFHNSIRLDFDNDNRLVLIYRYEIPFGIEM